MQGDDDDIHFVIEQHN